MSLSVEWIDVIFTKMTLVYGREFLSRWEGVKIEHVKADWAHELDGFQAFPQGIAYALANLPKRAPTVIEFREIARLAPVPQPEQLPHPHQQACPEHRARVLDRIRKLSTPLQNPTQNRNRSWAKRVVNKHNSGESVSYFALTSARKVLGK